MKDCTRKCSADRRLTQLGSEDSRVDAPTLLISRIRSSSCSTAACGIPWILVDFKLRLSLVRHGSPRTGFYAFEKLSAELAKSPSEQRIMALDRVCQISNILRTFQIDPMYCILEHFPLGFVLYLSWFCDVVVFFFLKIGHRIHGGDEYCLASFPCIFSSYNQP